MELQFAKVNFENIFIPLECNSNCKTCADYDINCTSCYPGTNRIFDDVNHRCPCPTGYFENAFQKCECMDQLNPLFN